VSPSGSLCNLPIKQFFFFFFYGISARFRDMASPTFFPSEASGEVSRQIQLLQGGVVSPTPNPQLGGPGYPFLSGSSITFDMSGMGAPASSYATAGIALRILWPRKPRHYVKVGIPSPIKQYHLILCPHRNGSPIKQTTFTWWSTDQSGIKYPSSTSYVLVGRHSRIQSSLDVVGDNNVT
jgi:hypothetical protein